MNETRIGLFGIVVITMITIIAIAMITIAAFGYTYLEEQKLCKSFAEENYNNAEENYNEDENLPLCQTVKVTITDKNPYNEEITWLCYDEGGCLDITTDLYTSSDKTYKTIWVAGEQIRIRNATHEIINETVPCCECFDIWIQ